MIKHCSLPDRLLVILLFLPVTLLSQEQYRELTLEQSLEIARNNSPDALNSRQSFRASYWEYRSYRAEYLPALNLSANPLPNFVNAFTQDQTNFTYRLQQTVQNRLMLSLDQMIGFTGGSISLNTTLERFDNLLIDDSMRVQYITNPINLTYIQPLFRYNPYRWDRKIKPLQYEVAKKKYLEDLETVNIRTTDYFFNLLQAQIDEKIALTNRSNYDTLFRIAKGRYELGKIAENELLMLELNLLKAQASVETAKLQLDNAEFYLKSYLRIKDTIYLKLLPPENIDYFTVNPVKAIEEAAVNSSASMNFDRQRLEAARDVNRAKMEGRFDVNIIANVGVNGSSFAGIPEAYKDFNNSQQISVGMSIPILDWGVARGRIKMAESQQEIVLNNIEQAILDYDRNIYLKVMQFNMQKNQIRIAGKADTVAQKTYEVTKGRYLIGKVTSILELNNSQMEADSYEKSYYNSLQTYWRSYYELRKMTLFDFAANRPLTFRFEDVRP